MKKLAIICLTFISLLSCEKHETETFTCEVKFSFNELMQKNEFSALASNAKNLILSIMDENDTEVYYYKTIHLYRMNDSYVSEPIVLNSGNYRLTTFLVSDEEDNIIYLSPRANSALAYLVENPLPLRFSVNKDETSKINVEVVPASIGSVKDFGYSTFEFNYIDAFTFCIAPFEIKSTTNELTLTEANIIVSSDNENIYTGLLNPATNNIILPVKDDYEITISKSGYNDLKIAISYDSIAKFNCSKGGMPFIAILNHFEQSIFEFQPGPEEGMDASIWNLKADTNAPYTLELSAIAWTNRGRNSIVRSLIKFDLSSIPPGTNIKKAELYLYGYNSLNNGSSNSLTQANYTLLARILTNWEENSVTWRNQPSFDKNDAILIDSCNNITNYKLDVTNHVKDMVQNPSQNYGWMLVLKDETYYQMMIFASSDNIQSKRPKLIIY